MRIEDTVTMFIMYWGLIQVGFVITVAAMQDSSATSKTSFNAYVCQDPSQYDGSHIPRGFEAFNGVAWAYNQSDRDCDFYLAIEITRIDPRFAGMLYKKSLKTVECNDDTKPTIDFYANTVGCCRDQKGKCDISTTTSNVSVSVATSSTTNVPDTSGSQAQENTSVIVGVVVAIVLIVIVVIIVVVVVRKNRKPVLSGTVNSSAKHMFTTQAKTPQTTNPVFPITFPGPPGGNPIYPQVQTQKDGVAIGTSAFSPDPKVDLGHANSYTDVNPSPDFPESNLMYAVPI